MSCGSDIARRRHLVSLFIACCLGACATEQEPRYPVIAMQTPTAQPPPQPAPENPPPAAPESAPTIRPLDYYEWAQRARPEELLSERLRLTSRQRRADPVIDAVHLGILMSVSAIASRETEREAVALLDSIDTRGVTDASREYAIFAELLLSHLEQRESLRTATSSVVESLEEVETLQRTNAELQQTIDALTSIEEQLIEREQAQEPE